MFDASTLSIFVQVARQGSFARASRLLGLPTTTTSRKIAQLEEALGVRLLNRSTRSLSLTDAGRVYFERVEPIVEEIEQANRAVTWLHEEIEGRLRVTAPQMLGSLLVTDWVLEFQTLYPRVHIELRLENQYLNLPEIGFDIAFRAGPLSDSGLVARPLLQIRFHLVATPTFLDQAGVPDGPRDLEHFEAVVTATGMDMVTWTFEKAAERLSVHPQGRLRLNDLQTALHAIRADSGMALLPDILVDGLLADGTLVKVLPDWRAPDVPIHLVYTSRRVVTSAQRAFTEFVVSKSAGGANDSDDSA